MSSEVCSVGRRCPLWVKSGHRGTSNQCPLYPRKRTLIKCIGKSASCQTHGQCSRAGRFVHISAVERAGLAELKAGQIIDYEIVEERGRKRAENLRIVAQPKG